MIMTAVLTRPGHLRAGRTISKACARTWSRAASARRTTLANPATSDEFLRTSCTVALDSTVAKVGA